MTTQDAAGAASTYTLDGHGFIVVAEQSAKQTASILVITAEDE